MYKLFALTAVVLILCFSLLFYYLSLTNDPVYREMRGSIYGTQYKVIYKTPINSPLTVDDVQRQVDEELNRIDLIASTWKKESEISRINAATSMEWHRISPDLYEIVEISQDIAEMSDGAFSITYQSPTTKQAPNFELDPSASTIKKNNDDVTFDLSAIAKGYAVDKIGEYLALHIKADSWLVEIGGEVKAHGVNAAGNIWKAGIYIPPSHSHIKTIQVELDHQSIATSGGYFKNGHIKDPKTQNSITNDLLSVSVIAEVNAKADALATALFVMGAVKGFQWAKNNNIQAIFIKNDGTILSSADQRSQLK